MKFSCIFQITFWCTLYMSEKSTAMGNVSFVIHPTDEGFSDISEINPETGFSDMQRKVKKPSFYKSEKNTAMGEESFVIHPTDKGFNDTSETNPETGFSEMQKKVKKPSIYISEKSTAMGDENFVIQPADEGFNDTSETNPETGFSDTQRKGKKPKSVRNCLDLKNQGKSSGIHLITPCDDTPTKVVKVYCDMDTDLGGWTVFQRRDNYPQQQEFNNTWNEYAMGFGDVSKDFWLGNDNIHCLSKQSANEIRIDLLYWNGKLGFANYGFFYVDDQTHKYKMELKNYTGNVGDYFYYHSNNNFSTFDQDNDGYSSGHCAISYGKGGWWYKSCWNTLLNGLYNSTVQWGTLVKKSEMKIRPRH